MTTAIKKRPQMAEVLEAHRCPRCNRKWAEQVLRGSGNPVLHMCPMCQDDLRCNNRIEHPSDCHCGYDEPEEYA